MKRTVFRQVAKNEPLTVNQIKKLYRQGKLVIPFNPRHRKLKPISIGQGCRVKINANIGRSPGCSSLAKEIEKLKMVERYGAHTVMDLSIGGDIRQFRRELIKRTSLCFGTVPIYEVVDEIKDIYKMNIDKYLEVLEKHGQDGVDFVTIHAGFRYKHLPLIKGRMTGIVSRGGSFMRRWMEYHKRESYLYEHFDKILAICKKYSMTISLGDGLRPGSIADNTDRAQMAELKEIGKLVLRCRQAGAQAIVEGPGHIPMNRIKENVEIAKKICHGAPFYVLGPLVTDVAAGYDHITAAIGGAWAAYFGTDFLCYVTPAEHLGLPSLNDVRVGVVASKIAAHAADIARGIDLDLDKELSVARKAFAWKKQERLSMDPEKFREFRQAKSKGYKACSMCGRYCAMLE